MSTDTPTTLRQADQGADTRHSDAQSGRDDVTCDLLRKANCAETTEQQRLREEAIALNIPLADSLARRYHDRGEDLDDLVQVARLGLVQAVRRFNPDRGDFSVYAVPTIAGELKRHFRDHAWMVRPPRRIQELQADLSATWSDLAQELGRIPTVQELSTKLGRAEGEVADALSAHGCFSAASLDAAAGTTLTNLHSKLGREDPDLERAEIMACLAPACAQLSPEDLLLLRLRFFDQLTQAEIAERLGTNQMAVSRRLSKIMSKLAHLITKSPPRQSTQRRAEGLERAVA